MENLMDDLKLAGTKQASFLSTIDDLQAKSSSILSFCLQWKDLDRHYGSIKETLLQQGRALAIQATEMEETRKRVDAREIEVEGKLEAAQRFLDEVRLKEGELGWLKTLISECDSKLQGKERELGFLQKALDELRREIVEGEGERGLVRKAVEEESMELQARREELAEVRKLIADCSSEHELQVKQLVECREELEGKQKLLERVEGLLLSSCSEIRVKEEEEELVRLRDSITECSAEYELKERQLSIVNKALQVKVKELDSVEERLKESKGILEGKEKLFGSLEMALDELREKVSGKEEELGSLQKSVEEQAKELDCRQKEVGRTTDLLSICSSELQRKKRELVEVRKMVVKWNDLNEKESSMEEGELGIEEKDLEGCREQLRSNWKLLGYMETALEEHCKQISFKEKDLSSLVKSIELKEDELSTINTSIVSRDKVLRVKDKLQKLLQSKIDEHSKELESMKEQEVSIQALVEGFALAVESNSKSLDIAGEQMKACCSKLELKLEELYSIKTTLIECRNKLADERKRVEERAEAVEMQRADLLREADLFRFRETELGSKEKLIEERFTELVAKEKELSTMLGEGRNKEQAGTADNTVGLISCESNSPDSSLEEPSQPDLTDDEVSTVLRSSDPAKMICYQLKQSTSQIGTKKYDQTEVRNRVVMLERLMGVPPNVSPEVRQAAEELAVAWRGNLRLEAHCSMDIIAFFLFLAAFGVTSSVKPADMLELAAAIAHHERAPELCRSLGLAKWMPELIQRLSKQNKHMEAIRFSLAFKLVHRFPPNLLLLSHLQKTSIFENGKELLESQYAALNNHLDSLKAMSQRVAGLGIDPSFLNQKIGDHLHVLETLLRRKLSCLLATGVVIKSQRHGGGGGGGGGAAVSAGSKSPLQVGKLTEGHRIKRQKN